MAVAATTSIKHRFSSTLCIDLYYRKNAYPSPFTPRTYKFNALRIHSTYTYNVYVWEYQGELGWGWIAIYIYVERIHWTGDGLKKLGWVVIYIYIKRISKTYTLSGGPSPLRRRKPYLYILYMYRYTYTLYGVRSALRGTKLGWTVIYVYIYVYVERRGSGCLV